MVLFVCPACAISLICKLYCCGYNTGPSSVEDNHEPLHAVLHILFLKLGVFTAAQRIADVDTIRHDRLQCAVSALAR